MNFSFTYFKAYIRYVSISNLKKGECYFREKGVNHNVINNNKFPFSFIEVEIKN